jgi:histidinol-phosphate aminotransferase
MLGVDSYLHVDDLGDDPQRLNLAWTLDEREFLSRDLKQLISQCLSNEVISRLPWTFRYLVEDPYGSSNLGTAVGSFFGIDGLAPHVSCAAGVNAWLQSLTALASGGAALVAEGCYVDFPHWLRVSGVRTVPMSVDADAEHWRSAMSSIGCGMMFLERPSFFGAPTDSLEELAALCRFADRQRAVVLVDESNANYAPPSFSAVPLVRQHNNLAVLRGLSKAYGLGGLRLGICVSSEALTPRIRAVTAPMQVSSLSLLIARSVLLEGDIAAPLRKQLTKMRLRAKAAIKASGFRELCCNPLLPYIILENAPPTLSDSSAGLMFSTKRHTLWNGSREIIAFNRCSIPLLEQRMLRFEMALSRCR